MKLETLMSWSDSFTDETQTGTNALAYANEGIAVVNTKCGLVLPYIETIAEDYTALPQDWFVRFLLNALNYGVKMNDSSLSEAYEYKSRFDIAIYDFNGLNKATIVAPEYLSTTQSSAYQIDTSNAIDIGWFGGTTGEW